MATFADDHKISDLVAKTPAGWFSFEYFPPKTAEGVENLKKRIVRMKGLGPLFTDFTWGAGGSTSELTLQLTSAAKNEFGTVANMHLTCTNQKVEMAGDALADCKKVGVRNIVALRGDPPRGQEQWTATEGGFNCALDLVKYMREKHGDYFCISVAGYPEGHPDAISVVEGGLASLSPSEKRRARVAPDGVVTVARDADFEKEMAYLKEKCDAGADFIITQMFLDAQVRDGHSGRPSSILAPPCSSPPVLPPPSFPRSSFPPLLARAGPGRGLRRASRQQHRGEAVGVSPRRALSSSGEGEGDEEAEEDGAGPWLRRWARRPCRASGPV
ncbi:unnamed protein product [Prorocentrum cordatum]|uniref:Methylenetetrahydrofolate reductase (NAD(P)H) n=1 Tax=Prorocentrum cordatum TaxID=2364126 RepID=A0ABN9SDP6_9DINO|nr:unnamed protein product [Polarella glacialis]